MRILSLSVLAALAVAASAVAGTTGVSTLRLVDDAPIVLRGTGFRALERVQVTASVDGVVRKKIVAAGRSGAFTVRFTALAADESSCRIAATASGGAGSRAKLRIDRMCPPPITP